MILKVHVTGVCGLSRVSTTDLRVLAAAQRTPSSGSSASSGHSHEGGGHGSASTGAHVCVPRHRAFLQFDMKDPNIVVDREVKFSTFRDGKTYGYFIFGNEVVTLKKTKGTDPVPPAAIDLTNIIEMTKVVHGYGDVNPAFVSPVLDPAVERVSAVLRLPGGRAAAIDVDHERAFTFEPMMGLKTYSGAFAQTVEIDLSAPDAEEWVLEAYPYGDRQSVQPILTFKGKANTFGILFGNAPVEDIVGIKDGDSDEIDHHFGLLYGLLDNAPGARSLPMRVSARRALVKLGGTNCPPAVLGP